MRTSSGSSPRTTACATRPTTRCPAGRPPATIVTSNSHRNLGSAKLTYNARAEPVARRHVPAGPARRHRRDQRRQPHAQRRSVDLPRARRISAAATTRCATTASLASNWLFSGAGRRGIGEELRRPRDRGRRRDPVPRRRQQLLPDRRLRPDPGQEVRPQVLRRLRRPATSAAHEIKGGLEFETESADVMQADVGRPAGRRLRQPGQPGEADLQPLLLDHARRHGRQRAGLGAHRLAEHKNTAVYLQDRWTRRQRHAQRSACAGTASRSSTPRASRRST